VVTASDDQTARVWDASSGKEMAVLRGHAYRVLHVLFSPDGTRVMTGCYDGTVRLWESTPHRERFPALDAARRAETEVRSIVRTRLAAGDSVETIRQAALNDRSLSEVQRRAYLIVTTQRREAQRLDEALWRRISTRRQRAGTADAGEFAADAERLLAMCDGDAAMLNTVGAAFVCEHRHREAIDILGRSESARLAAGAPARPSTHAFMAMALWNVGRHDEARRQAALARDAAAGETYVSNVLVQALLVEVDALVKLE
jgi:hypothetical protein